MPNDITAPGGTGSASSANTGNTRVYPQEEHRALKTEYVRNQYKLSILESAMSVSIHAGNDSQALLFRTAIDRINEVLGQTQGPDALQKAASLDNSPEATAGRILSFTTGLYAAYAARRSGDDAETVAKDFVALVRGGFEKGFADAQDILKGLNVLEGDVKTGIDKTYGLVQKGFDDFLANLLKPKEAAPAATGSTDAPAVAGASKTG